MPCSICPTGLARTTHPYSLWWSGVIYRLTSQAVAGKPACQGKLSHTDRQTDRVSQRAERNGENAQPVWPVIDSTSMPHQSTPHHAILHTVMAVHAASRLLHWQLSTNNMGLQTITWAMFCLCTLPKCHLCILPNGHYFNSFCSTQLWLIVLRYCWLCRIVSNWGLTTLLFCLVYMYFIKVSKMELK